MKNIFKGKIIVVPGGTGTIGTLLVERLQQYKPKRIRIITNDENSIWESQQHFGFDIQHPEKTNLRWILGDVRNHERMKSALDGADYVFHTAAVKQVPIAEYNPLESIDINLNGLINLVQLALESKSIKTFCNISTDKAVYPVSTMGKTKALTEDIIRWANDFKCKKERNCKFFNVRFCNISRSRGNVLELWDRQAKDGFITVTDPEMTRYFIGGLRAVRLILKASQITKGGETFVLKGKRISIGELANKYIKEQKQQIRIKKIGARRGEKRDEYLMTLDELEVARDLGDMWVV